MASFNKIVIVGYLGRDPEIRYTPQGTAVCNFSIATTEKRKGRDGEAQEITTWFRVQVWGASAEACNNYLTKGKQVYVEGRLQTRSYDDKDGKKTYITEVVAEDVILLSNRGGEAGGAGPEHAPASAPRGPQRVPTAPSGDPAGPIGDDDVPF